MWKYVYSSPYELYHHGIKDQHWGIRRWQNPDGTLTEAGKKRYWGKNGEYTYPGRRRYIKDLVKDYNELNGTTVKSRKAIVKIDGKYYNGKGVEIDPRNLEIKRLTGKTRAQDEAERNSIKITNDSTKRDIDKKPKDQMSFTELSTAKQYYTNLNALEEEGGKYAKRHMSFKQRFMSDMKGKAESEISEQGKKFMGIAIGIIGGWAIAKGKAKLEEKFKEG